MEREKSSPQEIQRSPPHTCSFDDDTSKHMLSRSIDAYGGSGVGSWGLLEEAE